MDEAKKFLLSRLKSILRKRYRKKHTNDDRPKELGFIAQDIQDIFPCLTKIDDYEDEDDDPLLSLPYNKFGIIAVSAIKELKEFNDTLESDTNELKTRIANIKAHFGL